MSAFGGGGGGAGGSSPGGLSGFAQRLSLGRGAGAAAAPGPAAAAAAPGPKFSGTACTTMPKLAEGEDPNTTTRTHCWAECSASTFSTRIGPNYAKNKQKAPSLGSLMELVRVDLVRTPSRIDDIGSKVTLPDVFTAVASEEHGVPPLFIINCQVPSEFPTSLFTEITDGPGWSIVYYFRLTPSTRDSIADLSNAPPAVKLFAKYCREAPEGEHDPKSKWRGRFKAMFRVENMESFGLPSFISSYNGKPVLIRTTGSLRRGDKYIEMDINLHRFSSVAKKGLQVLIPYFERMNVTAGFTIESTEDDEMPETLFGTATVVKGDYKTAPDF